MNQISRERIESCYSSFHHVMERHGTYILQKEALRTLSGIITHTNEILTTPSEDMRAYLDQANEHVPSHANKTILRAITNELMREHKSKIIPFFDAFSPEDQLFTVYVSYHEIDSVLRCAFELSINRNHALFPLWGHKNLPTEDAMMLLLPPLARVGALYMETVRTSAVPLMKQDTFDGLF